MGDERQLTARLQELFAAPGDGVELGIGDDAAVVRTSARTVLATDPVVEGVHFEPGTSLRLVGHKAVNRNLSDLAAMGATPNYLLASILLPARHRRQKWRLFRGLRDAAASADCRVVGGDVSATRGPLVVTVTAVGRAPRRVLRRDGLRPGQQLHLTGAVGGAAEGHHLRFKPRLAEGRWLAGQVGVRAAIDISDGLLLDLHTMLLASGGVGAVLDEPRIPVRPAARRLAREDGVPALQHALCDGEDHELLFALDPRRPLARGGPLTAGARRPVGQVIDGPGLFLRAGDGSTTPLPPEGYQHDV